MAYDLKDQIQTLMETGIRPVSAADIASRLRADPSPFPPETRPTVTHRRVTAVAIAFVAAGCAAALVTGLVTGPASARPKRPAPAMLTAAYIRQIARASRLALAHSGQAVVTITLTEGQRQTISTFHLTFSGADWINSSVYTAKGPGVRPLRITGLARVVDGQVYSYGGHAWQHIIGPGSVVSMEISDPRLLLAALAPTAHFVRVGTAMVDGVRVEHVRATTLTGLPAISLPFMPNISPYKKITALDVWVDSHGVVRRLALASESPTWFNTTAGQVTKYGGKQEQSAVVTFLDIGEPQVIRAPANAVTVRLPARSPSPAP